MALICQTCLKILYLISFNCQTAVWIFGVICRNLVQAVSDLTRCISCTGWGMFPQLEHQSLAKRRCLLSNFGTLLSARPLGKDTNKLFFVTTGGLQITKVEICAASMHFSFPFHNYLMTISDMFPTCTF